MVLRELIFKQFLLWAGVVVLKELIFHNSFYCFFHSFYFGRVWWS